MDFFAAYHPKWYIFNDSNLAFIQEFLVREGNPNKRYYSGVTILHDAINIPSDNIRVVRELINAGADVNLRTHLDLTPLHLAVSQRKQQVVKALIQSGASVNAKDFLGRTSLHFAVTPLVFLGPQMRLRIPPDPTIINNLLQHKDIDCNAMDSNGETALMMAVKDQEISAALQLLRNEANPNICNNDFETPLHAAFSLSPSYIEIQLLLSGANIYSVDKNGQTPLDILLKNGLIRRPNRWIILIIKIIAFKYNITSNLKQKFEIIPQLSQIFNQCCDEIDYMRRDIISGNITMHDFCCESFHENDFKHLQQHIYKPVVERLIRDIYPQYFILILNKIPKFSLYSILEMKASVKKLAKYKGKVLDLSNLFSILDVTFLFSKYLSNVEIFCLIVAFSDVMIVESMHNLHDRNFFYIFD